MTLLERQIELEKQYTNQGVIDALAHWEREAAEGRAADHYIGRSLSIRLYKLVQTALEESCTAGARGLAGKYRGYVSAVGCDIAAVVAIRLVLNLSTKKLRLDRTAPLAQDFISEAGTQVHSEYMHKMLSIAAPGYMHSVDKYMQENGTRSVNHRRRTLKASADRIEGVSQEDLHWSASELSGVGSVLLKAIVDAGVVTLEHVPKNNGQYWVCIVPVQEVQDKLQSMVTDLKAFMRLPPMLVPPKPHTRANLFSGSSYMSDRLSHATSTIHTRTDTPEVLNWISSTISDKVLNAANKAAAQPYSINSEVIELLRGIYRSGIYNGIAGIPSSTPIKVPEYPLPEHWDREDPAQIEIHEAWKALAKSAHSDEVQRKGQVIQFSLLLKHLTEFRGDTLYFPTYFDWRGRLYFRSNINPQGTDFVKASLSFANKKPLGGRGLYWLKVHVATCYGFDKANFDRRVTWVDDNLELIRDAVQHHVDSDFFRGADSHWCFYVAAKGLLEALALPNPELYETGIPVAMDATCSGLQHLSALLRDPVGGMFTNLIPNNGVEKEDIYAGVAAITVANIQKDKENIVQAQYWMHNGITRSMAKRPVMTYVYGGTLSSCTEYVYVDMCDRGLESLEEYSQFKLAAYASKQLRKGIEAAVPASAELMRFLRSLAGMMPTDKSMRWVSPVGFPVAQHYAQEESTRIQLRALGIQLVMRVFNHSLMQRSRVINGIAPNFTHSLDSAHLCTAIDVYEYSLLPIHDSAATHPCDVDTMHKVLRCTFSDMYKYNDPLQSLVDTVQPYVEETIEVPAKGTLDIDKVRDSLFFMC